MKITFEIPTAPPSRNQLDKMHWAKRDRLAKQFRALVSNALMIDGHGAHMRVVANGPFNREIVGVLRRPAIGHRFVRIVRRGPRTLDHDNLVGGCKPLVDALVKVGLLADDRPGLATVTYDQERGAGCRVEVRAVLEEAA